ncbi:uncharacterized protein si:ch211-149e23.4 isoform X1 [Micropterus salmoides]|uniref:uncharacterized protein si:ch211-149e23.4 isoform X1 n=1 Tax=Micropterus salmoides TaxID=27706 RepID=UPI0018ED23DB|nr:uncharacterized protein si:ch211-149e23.4 isoform X1 [Micropterus salmoides]
MSWLLPVGVSGVSWFNFTSHNGSHSVRGVLLLPACLPWELTAECVINHPAFEEPQNRSIILPLCARPNITISSCTEWKDGYEYTKVDCSVDSVAPEPNITWHVGKSDITSMSETKVLVNDFVSTRSSVHLRSSLYSGQDLTCMVEHPSLDAPEKRTIHNLVHSMLFLLLRYFSLWFTHTHTHTHTHTYSYSSSPLVFFSETHLSVSLVRQQNSPILLAVCECRGESVGANLAWVLPENTKGKTSLQSQYEGHVLKARLTYQFPLALHEGQDLTCVYHFEHGATEKRTIHIPRYYISSVRVLNHTTPLQSRYGGKPIIHRLTLQENHHNQRVLLRVESNVPEYNLTCKRSDGSYVLMDGVAMVFQSELTMLDEGLYTCQASFYHHTATVNIEVEIMNKEEQLTLVTMICIGSALAIICITVVMFWLCCNINSKTQYKKKESLSPLTALMQEPGSPEVKKPSVDGKHSEESAKMVSYSIVIDVKSTV